MARIQFILKARENPFTDEAPPDGVKKKFLSSGLLNSASFVMNMLKDMGHTVQLDHALDNNCIDRLVTGFKPEIAIIEAYWVVPEKFEVLTKLHPKIKWVIRNHSALPFLANEGMAMDWSLRYMDYKNVFLCSNDFRTDVEMCDMISIYKGWSKEETRRRVSLLSNYYPETFRARETKQKGEFVDLACFGALRPLKNHLIQAVAAVQYAEQHNQKLRFHINGTRMEMKGEPIARNLTKFFEILPKHELVQHPWRDHADFCETLRDMDVAMQVSYTETFNIVSADAVVNDVPVITSSDIVWVDKMFHADPNCSVSIKKAIDRAITWAENPNHSNLNRSGLHEFNVKSMKLWKDFVAANT